MSSSSSTSSDSNIYIATADSKDYLINPIDWNNITTHGVKDNSIPGSKIISIPVSKIVGDLPGGGSKADVDASNLSSTNITAWQEKLKIDTLDALVNTKQDKLTAGSNITITNNTISSTGTKYTAGTNISISDTNAISVSGLSKSSVGLGNVDNTSDANKPISTATQTALDALVNTKQDKLRYYTEDTNTNVYIGNYRNVPESVNVFAYKDISISSDVGEIGLSSSAGGVNVYGDLKIYSGELYIDDADPFASYQKKLNYYREADHIDYGSYANIAANRIEFDGNIAGTGILTAISSEPSDNKLLSEKAVATAISGKADKATTLAGYNIGDAYTKTETDTELGKKQDKQDNSLKTTSKTVVGAINENFDKVQNIFVATSEFTGFNGTISTESIMTYNITPYKIVSDGSIPVQIAIEQSTGNINHNGNICFGNRYYEPLDSENHYKVNTNGALGWYVWRRVFIDENGTEILPESYITITNVKLKYATGRVLTSNNISIKSSDWQYFQKAFNNRSVVINATRTIADGRSNYVVKYYQLSPALKVTKVGDLYQFTYSGVSFTVAHVSNYKFKATSTVDPSIELECVAQVKTLAELVNDATFAVIVPNTTSSDGAYTINFSMATSDDHFSDGTVNITSNNGISISDAEFIPTLNWNSNPAVTNINKCKLYLSNKQATVKQFTDNELPEQNLPNLFENLDNYTEVLGDFSYTQNSHYTGNLIHESHEYKDGYNTMILEYQPRSFGDSSNTNIVKLFSGEYGDEYNNIRSWDTSLRVTTNPELGCVQIFNFSYAEGFGTIAAGGAAHAEGKGCKTYEDFSHVEGSNNVNIGYGAHVEGWNNTNYGYGSHVEGGDNLCTVNYGHVEGAYNTVNGYGSHAEGYRTIASSQYQHVSGKWNIEDTKNKYAFIIGNGTTNERRSNAFTVDWDANLNINGNATFPYDKKIVFETDLSSVHAYYGTSITLADDINKLDLSYSQIRIQDGNSNKTTITADKISIGENNWSTELGYGKLLIAGDGIEDMLSYGTISSDTLTHAIKLPKGNTADSTSFQIWVGTQAEYMALTSKDPSTMYFIVATDGTVSIKFGV